MTRRVIFLSNPLLPSCVHYCCNAIRMISSGSSQWLYLMCVQCGGKIIIWMSLPFFSREIMALKPYDPHPRLLYAQQKSRRTMVV